MNNEKKNNDIENNPWWYNALAIVLGVIFCLIIISFLSVLIFGKKGKGNKRRIEPDSDYPGGMDDGDCEDSGD